MAGFHSFHRLLQAKLIPEMTNVCDTGCFGFHDRSCLHLSQGDEGIIPNPCGDPGPGAARLVLDAIRPFPD
jgi:hypothetical protein